MKSERMMKVNELITQRLASRLAELWGGRSGVATVTGVETAPDLRAATVWISLYGGATEEDVEPFYHELRGELSGLSLKYVPRLEFKIDRSGDYAQSLDEVFRRI
jgi:ribosome-binding factor A